MSMINWLGTNICPGNNIVPGFRECNDGWVRVCNFRNVYGVNVFNEGQSILWKSVQCLPLFRIRRTTYPNGRRMTPQFDVTFNARARLIGAIYYLLLCRTDVSVKCVNKAPLLAWCRTASKTDPKTT